MNWNFRVSNWSIEILDDEHGDLIVEFDIDEIVQTIFPSPGHENNLRNLLIEYAKKIVVKHNEG